MVVALVLAAVLAGLITSCAWLVPRLDVPMEFWMPPIESVSIDGRELRVVRVGYTRGLREVESLGGLDGALFVLDEVASTSAGMGMGDTPIPLDVAFFDPAGQFIDRFTMPVCDIEDCPAYFPTRPWQFAIEAPAGDLACIPTTAILRR